MFIWRGKGILGLLKSKWGVLYYDPKQELMFVYFEKTMFTPKGCEVISRKAQLSEVEISEMRKKLQALGIKNQDSNMKVLENKEDR